MLSVFEVSHSEPMRELELVLLACSLANDLIVSKYLHPETVYYFVMHTCAFRNHSVVRLEERIKEVSTLRLVHYCVHFSKPPR